MTRSNRFSVLAIAIIAAIVVIGSSAFVVVRTSSQHSNVDSPGAVDIGFSQDMAVHHEQAILMANLALSQGGPAVRAISTTILVNQSQEIGLTRGWLKLWHEPAVDPHPMQWMTPAMASHSMTDGPMPESSPMPGMASPDELNALYQLSGKKFDVQFLRLMIRHHLGGIGMAKAAMDHADIKVVRQAASSMIVEQVEDLGTMRALLTYDGGTELPAP